jgi:hypothetical protein
MPSSCGISFHVVFICHIRFLLYNRMCTCMRSIFIIVLLFTQIRNSINCSTCFMFNTLLRAHA